MRRAILSLLFLGAVVAMVIVLREDLPQPPQPTPVQPEPQAVVRSVVTGLDWRKVALPEGTDQVHRSAVDLDRAIFPVQGADGVRRIVTRSSAAVVTEVARGKGPSPLGAALDGAQLVSYEVSGLTRLSTVDLRTAVRSEAIEQFPAETVAIAGGSVALLDGDRCLHFLDVVTLRDKIRHCAATGWSISFLTAEMDTVQWRETSPGDACATWFRLEKDTPKVVETGQRACRAATLVLDAGWEVTADFPAYELGVLYPGPLVARQADREIALDTTVVDVHPCGAHVYWLSKPNNASQQGELARWRPGQTVVEVVSVGDGGAAASPRCVNGVLNVATYGSGAPQLWTLPNP
ncbi:MAG: hypothetical protein ABW224_07425 [Kibdelosporangium sp.]